MWSQVGLRKHHYWKLEEAMDFQAFWKLVKAMKFQEFYRWCWESAALNMPASLENSAVALGLDKVSFHSNP